MTNSVSRVSNRFHHYEEEDFSSESFEEPSNELPLHELIFTVEELEREEEKEESGIFHSIKKLTGYVSRPIVHVVKKAGIVVSGYIADGKRQTSEKFLSQLLGLENVTPAISRISPHLNRLIEWGSPEIYQSVTGGERHLMSRFTEPLLFFVLHNLSLRLFPDQAEKIEHGIPLKEDEKISVDTLISSMALWLFDYVSHDFLLIDEAVENKAPLTLNLFKPLTNKILNALLPPSQENLGYGTQIGIAGIKYKLVNPISKLLMEGYESLILGKRKKLEQNEPQENGFSLEPFWPIIEEGIAVVSSSVSKFTSSQEKEYFFQLTDSNDLFDLVESIIHACTEKNESKIRKMIPHLDEFKTADFKNVITAIALKGIGNLLKRAVQKKGELTEPLSIQEAFYMITNFLQNEAFDALQEIQVLEKSGEKLKPCNLDKFSMKVISLCFDNDENQARFVMRRFPLIMESLSTALCDLYHAFSRKGHDSLKKRLRIFLWDEAKFRRDHPTLVEIPTEISKDLSILLGSEKLIEQIENLCSHVGDGVAKGLKSMAESKKTLKVIATSLSSLLQIDFNKGFMDVFEGVFSVFEKDDLPNEMFRGWIKEQVSHFLLKAIVILIEKGNQEPGTSKNAALFHAIKMVIDTFSPHMASLFQEIKGLVDEEGTLPEDKEEQAIEHFKPISSSLMTLLLDTDGSSWIIPLPKKWAESLGDEFVNRWLPSLLLSTYLQTYQWIFKKQKNKQDLHQLYGNHRIPEAARVISHYVQQFVPFYLKDQAEEATDAILDASRKLLIKAPGELLLEEISLTPSDDHPLEWLRSMLKTTLQLVGMSRLNSFQHLFKFFQSYSEGFLLEVFLNASRTIDSMEIAHKSKSTRFYEGAPHVRAIAAFLEEAHVHFSELNAIKDRLEEAHAHKVPYDVMANQFDVVLHKLHPALKVDDAAEKYEYFLQLTSKLLPFLGIEEGNLPVPKFLASISWDIAKDHLFPLIIKVLTEQAISPESILKYLETLFSQMTDSLNRIEAVESEESIESVEKPLFDPLQRELESVSGSLLKELIGREPSLAAPFVHSRSFKERGGELIGSAIRKGVENKTPLELIDLAVQAGLPAFHPGGWVTRNTKRQCSETNQVPVIDPNSNGDCFFPLKTNSSGEKVKGWDFGFPKNERHKAQLEKQSLKTKKKSREKITRQLAEIMQKQSCVTIQGAILGAWDDFQRALDKEIRSTFGKAGLRLKKALDKAFQFLWKFIFFPSLKVLLFPLIRLTAYLLKKYFIRQARMRVKDIESPIHQNMLLRSIDRISSMLVERANMTSSRSFQS